MTSDATQSFVLRVWRESGQHGEAEWRGELRHVPTGRSAFFRTLEALPALVRRQAEEPPARAEPR